MSEDDLNHKINRVFPGKVVRKDLTEELRKGANVPVYVLEYLLGMYCATDDEASIDEGVTSVKKILTDNYVRPDEAEKIKSKIRELGHYTVIDKVTVVLNEKKDQYEAYLMNLGLKGILVPPNTVKQYEKLLGGGIWCILQMGYFYEEGNQKGSPFLLESLKPIQMPALDLEETLQGRKAFDRDEWLELLMRSIGMEPTTLSQEACWHLLARMIPLCENNYNVCELGPRGTGKSHIYKEISPNSILVSGGQTTVANLFYNMASRQVGLVGLWDVVAFDEVAGIHFKDKDGIQIMKDYMASGSFSRGKSEIGAYASMVFVGNIDNVEQLVRTSHLLAPFPAAMIDTAFFDRFHAYLPGWEIPKFRPENFTSQYGFIVDYLAEWLREMRKRNFSDAIGKFFALGNNLNQRDSQAVRKTTSGLLKLLFPDESYLKEDVERCLRYALVTRRRIKEQLKRIGGMEFYDVHFSYIDKETQEEHFVTLPEQGGGSLVPPDPPKPGHVYSIAEGQEGMLGLYRIELSTIQGSGKLVRAGLANHTKTKDAVSIAFHYFKGNSQRLSGTQTVDTLDFHLHLSDMQGAGQPEHLGLPILVALASASAQRSVQDMLVILGDMTLGGTINPVSHLANTLQVAFDCGAKRVLLPMANASDIATVPPELFGKFQISFYTDPGDAILKAMGLH